MKRPVITLLTDFGLADHYVACMKGVILGICPQAEIIDISHDVAPFSIPEGAYTLAQAWQCFPKGTTHLAVVDPGVGTARRAIVAEVAGHRVVVPDNGLVSMVLNGHPRAKVREVTVSRYFRQPVSNTFHGRDIFAPVSAHLANGVPSGKLGDVIYDTIRGNFAKPTQIGPGQWVGSVLKIDRFGNVISNLDWATFHGIGAHSFKLRLGRRTISRFYPTYGSAPAGRIFAIKGSSGFVELSLNQSDASLILGVAPGAELHLTLHV